MVFIMKMYIKNNKGFTLIELLVVISIIGLLSSIILASLNSARAKGGDAGVKANLASLKSQAEILYDQVGCYGNTSATCTTINPQAYGPADCVAVTGPARMFNNSIIKSQITAAKTAGSNGFTSCASTVAGTAYAVAVQLNSKTVAWCVDSTGASRQLSLPSNAVQADIDALITDGAGAARCD